MDIRFRTQTNKVGVLTIEDVTIAGEPTLQSLTITADSTANDVFTPLLYRVGEVALVVSDNNVYLTDWYGKKVIIYVEGRTIFKGRISQQLQNSGYNYVDEVINLSICDELTWAKSIKYNGRIYGELYDILKDAFGQVYPNNDHGVFVQQTYTITGNSPLNSIVNIQTDESKELYVTDVLERAFRYLCVSAVDVDNVLCCLDFLNVGALVEGWKLSNGVWNYDYIERSTVTTEPCRANTTVSAIDPKKSVTITAEFKNWELPKTEPETGKAEYFKLSYHGINVAVLQALQTYNNIKYWVYECADSGSYKEDAPNPTVAILTTESDFVKSLTPQDIQPKSGVGYCNYYAGAIHSNVATQALKNINDSPTGDESKENVLMLYGLFAFRRSGNITEIEEVYFPMYHRTFDINTMFSQDAVLIYSLSAKWQRYREETFPVDYQGGTIRSFSFYLPILLYRLTQKDPVSGAIKYIEPENNKVAELSIFGGGFDDTWTVIMPRNSTEPDNYNDNYSTSFDDYWDASSAVGNAIRLPKNVLITQVEVVFLFASQASDGMISDTRNDIAANLACSETWKIERTTNTSTDDTDTQYVWTNDYPQISGDEQKEDADFPSYDGKKESTNITYYRDINEVRVVTDNVSGAMGQGLHPEEYRLKMYETQYSRPTFAMKTTLDGAPRTLTLHREPTTNKIMKINGYLYNVVEDVTETNLIEVKA